MNEGWYRQGSDNRYYVKLAQLIMLKSIVSASFLRILYLILNKFPFFALKNLHMRTTISVRSRTV